MRPVPRLFAALILLAACQMQAPHLQAPQLQVPQSSGTDPAAPLAPEAIMVTTLAPVADAGPAKPVTLPATSPQVAVQVPDKSTPRPAPRPDTPAQASDRPVQPSPDQSVPAPVVSPEQAICQKSGGEWSEMAGSTGHVCAHRLRDGGKSCRKKGDCLGECLARSNTCAPIAPLMGCNDILQVNGTEVTLCLQ